MKACSPLLCCHSSSIEHNNIIMNKVVLALALAARLGLCAGPGAPGRHRPLDDRGGGARRRRADGRAARRPRARGRGRRARRRRRASTAGPRTSQVLLLPPGLAAAVREFDPPARAGQLQRHRLPQAEVQHGRVASCDRRLPRRRGRAVGPERPGERPARAAARPGRRGYGAAGRLHGGRANTAGRALERRVEDPRLVLPGDTCSTRSA